MFSTVDDIRSVAALCRCCAVKLCNVVQNNGAKHSAKHYVIYCRADGVQW